MRRWRWLRLRKKGSQRERSSFWTRKRVGRLTDVQAGYFFGWTEVVAASGYKPGAYLRRQKDADGTGPDGRPAFITTAQDVREHIAKGHLHDVVLWVTTIRARPRRAARWQRHGSRTAERLTRRVAICAISTPAGADQKLRRHLCRGRTLLCRRDQGPVRGPERGGFGGSFRRSLKPGRVQWMPCRFRRLVHSRKLSRSRPHTRRGKTMQATGHFTVSSSPSRMPLQRAA